VTSLTLSGAAAVPGLRDLPARTVLACVVVATLPLTYAMTVRLGFPLKIYELALIALAVISAAAGRFRVVPGVWRYVAPLAAFLALGCVVLAVRLAVPLDTFTTTGFTARVGPTGDAVLKIAYWCFAIFAMVVVATLMYESPERTVRLWLRGANCAAVYGWILTLSSALQLPAPLLPGMERPQVIDIAGLQIFRGGTFEEGNYFALYLLTSLAIALWQRWRRTAWLLSATVFITFSTANVAGLALLLAIHMLGQRAGTRDIRTWVRTAGALAGGVLLITAILFATGYLETFFIAKLTGAQFGSKLDRLDTTVAGLRMAADHPFTGVGLSHYGYNYRPYQLTDLFDATRPVKPIANNPWVELLAETGLIGVTLFFVFAARVWATVRTPALAPLRAGLASIALGLLTFPSITMTFLWAYCGVLIGLDARRRAHTAPS
jgi:O-antigen ligase